ncbi:MAG: RdgB/HAM1 family non-canonical purine NTP pyrophosphatase [Burkholderiales bacterium]
MHKIVIASNNRGKLAEIERVLVPFDFEPIPQSVFHVPEIEEPHCTFVENALIKARHASRISGLPALADDSGICVDALRGEPGVHSARYAGEPSSDQRNNQKLLDALHGKADRKAHYYCVIVALRHAADPQPVIAEGSWHGEILSQPRGEGGFGYDPLFVVPELGRTGAELSMDEKNRISHRGKALQNMIDKISRDGFDC